MSNKKHTFLVWYFSKGFNVLLKGLFELVKYIPRYFSTPLLIKTLLAPWHKDVSMKSWRGFDLGKSFERFIWNLISRVVGAVVRLIFIFIGLSFSLIVLILSGLIAIIYFVLPGALIVAIALMFTKYAIVSVIIFIVSVLTAVLAFKSYTSQYHKSYRDMSITELTREKWFHRVWDRLDINPEEITDEVLKDLEKFKQVLRKKDITLEECERVISWEIDKQEEKEAKEKFLSREYFETFEPIGRRWHYGFTVNLDRFASNLTRFDNSDFAHRPFYGHKEEMDMLELVMTRPNENNVIILGEPGVGRRMIVHELARRIKTMKYDHPSLRNAKVLQVDLGGAIASVQQSGKDPEYELNNLFHEAAYAGNVILVVENFEKYMENIRGFSFTTMLSRYAPMPTFRMIAITTENEFHNSVEQRQGLLMHFDLIHMKEMSEEEAMKTLFMQFYAGSKTLFTYQALREVVSASYKYTNTAPLPERALNLANGVLLHWQKNGVTEKITKEDVLKFVSIKTGIPTGKITKKEKKKLINLEERFHDNLIGQDEAVRVVANAVRRMRSGMARPNRPAGSFLFLGPTGVGKTEMTKTIAQEYFGSKEKMIRFDMSEYNTPQALAKMIGSRATGKKGRLTSLAQEHPYGILLLDELEKANPDILDIFLQVLDEGMVHDAFGKKINFTTMIIVATSNAGAVKIQEHIKNKTPYEQMKEDILNLITKNGKFRPEFINRFDDVVVFRPISRDEAVLITKLLLKKFAQRTEQEQNIRVVFDDDVAQEVVVRGYNELFGARSIHRYIDNSIADALAMKLITGDVYRGEDITFGVEDLK